MVKKGLSGREPAGNYCFAEAAFFQQLSILTALESDK